MADGMTKDKAALREDAKRRRAEAHAELGADAGARVRDVLLASIELGRDAAVGSYWPFRDEIDSSAALEHFFADGHACGLPIASAKGRPMVFRPWRPGMRLAKGRLGEPVPPPDADYFADDVVPSVLLVPLLAFDRRGFRLGYGGGYYDATIAALRTRGAVLAIGLAYAAQEIDAVPNEPHDQQLDWIVTEIGAIETGAGLAG